MCQDPFKWYSSPQPSSLVRNRRAAPISWRDSIPCGHRLQSVPSLPKSYAFLFKRRESYGNRKLLQTIAQVTLLLETLPWGSCRADGWLLEMNARLRVNPRAQGSQGELPFLERNYSSLQPLRERASVTASCCTVSAAGPSFLPQTSPAFKSSVSRGEGQGRGSILACHGSRAALLDILGEQYRFPGGRAFRKHGEEPSRGALRAAGEAAAPVRITRARPASPTPTGRFTPRVRP
ncbi:PREDICTED: uncharacterized protein LOC106628029 [Pseudopodoces humilis]|uniref:uncharacterized protein LOC106628029 n=1 Tax=Pseudopodoces humilis TaxID=181119 RepID=UPI0006B6FC5E|nr:PREDICTED: uncharacterized protein LOC106628029 [Pseudopodoces humilis]